jgi:glycosyltransferase involved in cell wall biosynthesis
MDIDDPARPSGGNYYDRRLLTELSARGCAVHEHAVADDLAATTAALPDAALVLVDGMIAHRSADVALAAARRMCMVVLLHMLIGDARERAVLSAATAVITTSEWGRDRVIADHGLPPERVYAAVPGVDPAAPAAGTADGAALLCVAAVAHHKGQDVLFEALAKVSELPWRLTLVGRVDVDPAFVTGLRRRATRDGTVDRVRFAGPLSRPALDRVYEQSDVLVHPTRGEMYGLVITEALARGLPVIASDVDGVPEALGCRQAGLLVPVGDPPALAEALRAWLSSQVRREPLRTGALRRRPLLTSWASTADTVTSVLRAAGREHRRPR